MCLCKTNSKYHAKLLLQDVILLFHVMLLFVCVNYVFADIVKSRCGYLYGIYGDCIKTWWFHGDEQCLITRPTGEMKFV